jgi:hypothetical protein
MPERQMLTEPRSGGGLLLLRRNAPLTRRTVAYFCSGAHSSRYPWKLYLSSWRRRTFIAKSVNFPVNIIPRIVSNPISE